MTKTVFLLAAISLGFATAPAHAFGGGAPMFPNLHFPPAETQPAAPNAGK